jgi:hypothetical protein
MGIGWITKERFGKAIFWIGLVGGICLLAGSLALDYVMFHAPRVVQQSTDHTVEWDAKGQVYFITPTENWLDQNLHLPTYFMVGMILLGRYLTTGREKR